MSKNRFKITQHISKLIQNCSILSTIYILYICIYVLNIYIYIYIYLFLLDIYIYIFVYIYIYIYIYIHSYTWPTEYTIVSVTFEGQEVSFSKELNKVHITRSHHFHHNMKNILILKIWKWNHLFFCFKWRAWSCICF